MKVIGINGSPRKHWNSADLLEQALNGARSMGAEAERIDLIDLNFSGCKSCFACKLIGGNSFGRCALKDDLKPVLDKILTADAVVISMPVYFGDAPGMVRNLFERIWFPGLMYKKDGSIAYDKKVKVGLIYTMNVTDASFYDSLISSHQNTFQRFLGETQALCATDTLQYEDYSRYVGDIFDPVHKKEHHENHFPHDRQKAFELGKALFE